MPNSLIDSYSKCGTLGIVAAKKLFMAMGERDVVSWNSMMGGLVKEGDLVNAHKVFDEMPERDTVSWNTIMDGYAKAGEMNVAFELFQKMPTRNVISWSVMVSGYSKAGDMEMARMLFDRMPVKNLITWTIIISGYAAKGISKDAICMYNLFEKTGLNPDDGTFVSILAACAESGMLGLGKRVHASIQRARLKSSILVFNALVDMYAKCGRLKKAMGIFNGMRNRDVVSWNTMILGLAMHGHGEDALELFLRMKLEGFKPDKVTFVGILCACTHAGLVDEGLHYFNEMEKVYRVTPQVEHYGCMVDLLGRGGRLEEACKLVTNMPFEPNTVIWGTLLGACRMHNAVALAKDVLCHLLDKDPSDAGNYSMGSNICAAAGDWDGMASLRMRMRSQGIEKPSGASSIELYDEIHEFTVSDKSHPKSDRIYHIVDSLRLHFRI